MEILGRNLQRVARPSPVYAEQGCGEPAYRQLRPALVLIVDLDCTLEE
ncbi:MAG: hypothetical protein QW584_02000 [Thermofilaceae archaeon]